MRTTFKIGAMAVASALALAACSSSDDTATDGASGGAAGGKTLVVSSDLPLQGAAADANNSTNDMIKLYLEQVGNKAGDYSIEFKTYDNATAAKGSWDDATCAKNAQDHVANTGEVAVMGTYNSGCAKIIVPVLNQDPDGPMLMVSHANTNPGLTKTWDPGEPDIFYPKGTRNYARVVTTDDYQGQAAAQFIAKELGLKKCFVINDNQTYGQGVAKAFVDEATKQGIEILGNEPWDAKQPNYSAFFEQIKATNPDCLYVGGIYDNNGGQLVKDKIKVLGDNKAVPMMGPDGFTGYTDLQAQPEAEGMYLSFAGLDQSSLLAAGGAGADLVKAYQEKYGKDPVGSYPLYGVAAMQVILDAIAKSDGTRKGVTDAVFSGEGITIPADKAVIGKEIKIDTASGDSNNKDISILQMTGGKELLVMPWILP
ncbi:MAG TPA: branched-chain amino acid ABC transporter substrate-binding protein [Dermatophilaceae bacterium]|nr:branched-chain amino acid ABC transporter substrate-binding protein [Dermatophilaceae bacterium]